MPALVRLGVIHSPNIDGARHYGDPRANACGRDCRTAEHSDRSIACVLVCYHALSSIKSAQPLAGLYVAKYALYVFVTALP